MTRVKIDVDFGDYDNPNCSARPSRLGRYSLSSEDYADYVAISERWEAWQDRLFSMQPDAYVAPPPYVPTKEEIALREFQQTDAYLDIIAPIKAA